MIHTLGTPEDVEIRVDTSSGARLTSLCALGRQWLVEPLPGYGSPGSDFIAPGMGGWDEAIPSITADALSRDHGNVWDVPWKVHSASNSQLVMLASLEAVPATLHRTLRLVPDGFALKYQLLPQAASEERILWSAHPQFLAEMGTEVRYGGTPGGVPARRLGRTYPARDSRADIPTTMADLPRGSAEKYFVADATWAVIRHPDGTEMRMDWSGITTLGLWFDHAQFAPTRVIGLEPTTSATDSRLEAAAAGSALRLDRPHTWSVRVRFSGASPRFASP